MISASIDSALEVLSLLINVAAVIRLTQLKLYRVYPFFFAFLCIPIPMQAGGVLYGMRSHLVFWCYVILEPILNILFILVVWELFSGIFRNYKGLRSLSRWVMGGAAAIAPIGFVFSIAAPGSVYKESMYIRDLVRFERGIAMGLVIFIIIMLYFISRYPIKLPRNNVVLCMLYSVWFLGDAAILLGSSFIHSAYGPRIVNGAESFLGIGCYLGWTCLLSKAGEYQEIRVRRDIAPEHERALIGELDAMNEMLLRAGRSISHSR